ncbi:MAG: hypothetical protein AB1Z23_08070 [Eubacteriales bacterium]
MKQNITLVIVLFILMFNTSCDIIIPQTATPTVPPVITTVPEITNIPLSTQDSPAEATDANTIATVQITMPPVGTVAPAGGDPTPYNTMSFYSCYANMVSYDPATGWAEFDYFYILKGQEAIDYLVSHEGYTQQAAADLVNDFADGEYVCQNDNPGLRTIDLDTVPIKLMFHSDGTQVPDSIAIPSTSADVTALYNLDHKYLFDYFFFYIHCDSDGNVILVEQVYWC